eukprot:1316423-Pyramimonas_sp.AAC.1
MMLMMMVMMMNVSMMMTMMMMMLMMMMMMLMLMLMLTMRRYPNILILYVRRPPWGGARTEKSYSIFVVAGAFWPHRS